MKGKTLARALNKCSDQYANLMEAGQDMKYDGSTKKDIRRVTRQLDRVQVKWDRLSYHMSRQLGLEV